MRVVDLYKVLDDNVLIRIVNENGEHIMWGNPFDIPVGILEYRVKAIRNPKRATSIADIEIVIER